MQSIDLKKLPGVIGLISVFVLVAVFPMKQSVAAVSFVDLSSLTTMTDLAASDVSDDGSMVVGSAVAETGGVLFPTATVPWRWSSAGGFEILRIPVIDPPNGFANAVSGDGSAVVGYTEAFDYYGDLVWSSGLGFPECSPFLSSVADSTGYIDISSDGSVIIGNRYSADLAWDYGTYRCTADGIGSTFAGIANALSANGSVIVGLGNSSASGISWTEAGGAINISTVSGYALAVPQAVSEDGSVIAGCMSNQLDFLAPTCDRAFMWTQSGGTVLLDQLPGAVVSQAMAVSGDGSFVAGSVRVADGAGVESDVAVLWATSGEVVDLQASLENRLDGTVFNGRALSTATGISRDAGTMVGESVNTSGERGSWITTTDAANDADGDGYFGVLDCNDSDGAINPGAQEIVNDGIDQNCDGSDLFDLTLIDDDLDGFNAAFDCNDSDASIYPGAEEIANDGIDQDCDGSDLIDLTLIDDDLDGFNATLDCNDNNASIYPGAPETKHDGIDQDCNGYDLTIDIVKAEVKGKRSYTLSVTATSALGANAALVLEGYGPLDYNARKNRWTATLRKLATPPATVTVTGTEGSETVATGL